MITLGSSRLSPAGLVALLALAAALAACADDTSPAPATSSGTGGAGGSGAAAGTGGQGAAGGSGGSTQLGPIAIPAQQDWTDHGVILEAGGPGEWDLYLWGGFAGSAVKQDGIFYLYYQGANGYDELEDTVTYRAIGVATSSDGLTFVKHAANPVLTWLPNSSPEEGAASGGACVGSGGEIVIYYGANTAISPSQVNADGRLAVSSDGLSFEDQGRVIDHADPAVWGSGDELFPVLGFEHDGVWHAYYIPNGSPEKGQLGLARGPARDALDQTGAVLQPGGPVPAWGMASHAVLSADTHALFVSDVAVKTISVWTMSPALPDSVEGPVESYSFSDFAQGTVLLDEETSTWYLYYRNEGSDAYGVKTAPLVRL